MNRKSTSCFGKHTNAPLTQYATEYDAREGAKHAHFASGISLTPYKCAKCHYWHLSPQNRQTPSTPCRYCKGRDGRPKARYNSPAAARRRADILFDESGILLDIYRCPRSDGWHLTKEAY